MSHVLIGGDLLLKIDQIVSANLLAKNEDDKPCIKVTLENGVEWTVYSDLEASKRRLKTIAKNNNTEVIIKKVKRAVYKNRRGRESYLSKEIKEILETN